MPDDVEFCGAASLSPPDSNRDKQGFGAMREDREKNRDLGQKLS